MNTRRYGFLLVLAVLMSASVVMSGCGAPGNVVLDATDDGRTVELKQDQSLELELTGNPTTGFMWEVVVFDDAVLRLAGEAEFEPDSNLVGAPGVLTFRFEPVAAGETDLDLEYRRPWEEDLPPLRTYSIRVIVSR